MNVLRHWLAHDVQGTVVVKSEAVAAKYREHGTPLEGPFVPEATYRGAVDLADEFEMLADACGHCLAAGRPPNEQMIASARAALAAFRGQ